MRDTRDLSEFEPLKAWLLNELRREVERLNKLSVSPPLELLNQGGGPSIRLVDNTCYAKVTEVGEAQDNGAIPHAWQEQQINGDGTFSNMVGGRQGTTELNPLYNIDGGSIDVDTVVRARLGLAGEWYCQTGGGGGDTIIRVTSGSVNPESLMYPAIIQEAEDGTPVTLIDGSGEPDCWVISLDSELAPAKYSGTFLRYHWDGFPVYAATVGGCTGGGGGGSGVTLPAVVTCNNGLSVTNKVLTGTVEICGVNYGVSFTLT